jgi:probable addiction module antidote protein
MVKTKPFDAAEVLDSPEMIAAHLTEAFGSDDPALMAMAIGAVARSQGMSAVAEKAGLSRENLYRALGGDAPSRSSAPSSRCFTRSGLI